MHIGPFSQIYIPRIYVYQTYSIGLTVPLKVTTVPPSGETVPVGEPYKISCVVTGDEAPTDNPWLHSNKTVQDDTKGGVKVTTVNVTLPNIKGINSTITFTKVTEDQFGDYICSAGDGKHSATVTLVKKAGKWNVQLNVLSLHDAGNVVYRVFLGRCKMPQVQVCYFKEEFCN